MALQNNDQRVLRNHGQHRHRQLFAGYQQRHCGLYRCGERELCVQRPHVLDADELHAALSAHITVHERIQGEVQEIAEVLSRQSGCTIIEVWNEALSLHGVRYETDVLRDEEKPACQ